MNCPQHDVVMCPCAQKGEARFNHDEPVKKINVSSGEDAFFEAMEQQVKEFLFPEYAEPQNYYS